MNQGGLTRVGDLVGDLLERKGLVTQFRRMGALDAWEEAVGEKIAGVTRARSVAASTLFVEVRSSAWLMELSMMKDDFLERVNERLGDVALDRIVFVLAETE